MPEQWKGEEPFSGSQNKSKGSEASRSFFFYSCQIISINYESVNEYGLVSNEFCRYMKNELMKGDNCKVAGSFFKWGCFSLRARGAFSSFFFFLYLGEWLIVVWVKEGRRETGDREERY
jgi:hypothetical protein